MFTSPFHNSATKKVIVSEKFWHKLALHYAVRSRMSAKEIAGLLGVSVSQVRILFRQPWFQRQCDALAAQVAQDYYERLLNGKNVNLPLTPIEVRNIPDKKDSIRSANAFAILDRKKERAATQSSSSSEIKGSAKESNRFANSNKS